MTKKIIILISLIVLLLVVFFVSKGSFNPKSSDSEPTYSVFGKYATYDVLSNSKVVAACSALTVFGGDEYVITKYKDRVKNGNRVNQIDGNGYLVLNIKIDGLTKEQKELLTSSSTVTLQIKKRATMDPDGFYCGSFVDIVSVEPYIAPATTTGEPGPRLIGNGTETYELTGYYYPYNVEFYPLDYDPARDKGFPKQIACQGFAVTSGSSDFIEAYRSQIKKVKLPEGNIVINLNDMTIKNPMVRSDASSPLSSMVTSSTPDHQINLKFKVWPFPERDTNPCDSYGIYIPAE